MADVLFVYPDMLEIPVHPEFDRYERLMLSFAEERELIGLARGTIVPPTAMLSLAAFLNEAGISTRFLDLTVESCAGNAKDNVLISALKSENPKLVAVNGMEDCFLSQLYEIARQVKRYDEQIAVVTGGVSATARDNEILTAAPVDFVIRGEGEQPLRSLACALLHHDDVTVTKGLSWMHGGRLRRTEEPPLLQLDQLPLPDRAGYPLARLYALNGGVDLMYASRGCVCNCAFCNAPAFWKRQWRAQEPASVVAELALLEEYGAKMVHIYDLNFGIEKRWVAEVCREIKKEKLDLVWDCELALQDFTRSFLSTLAAGNCRGAFCGIEAVSQSVLDSVNKRYKSQDLQRYLRNAKEAGIHVDGGYVFGLPEDDLAGLRALTRLASRLLAEDLVETPAPFLFVPFKGTEIGDHLDRYGVEIANSNTDEWHFFPPRPIASTRYTSAEAVHREWVTCLIAINDLLDQKLGGP